MRAFLAVLILSISTSSFANDIVTNHKDKVIGSFSYSRSGQATVKLVAGKFVVANKISESTVYDDSSISKVLAKQVEADLENSQILNASLRSGQTRSAFHEKLNVVSTTDIIESNAIKSVITDLSSLRNVSKGLKYKIKIANYRSNGDEKCFKLKPECTGSYTIDTTIDIIK